MIPATNFIAIYQSLFFIKVGEVLGSKHLIGMEVCQGFEAEWVIEPFLPEFMIHVNLFQIDIIVCLLIVLKLCVWIS